MNIYRVEFIIVPLQGSYHTLFETVVLHQMLDLHNIQANAEVLLPYCPLNDDESITFIGVYDIKDITVEVLHEVEYAIADHYGLYTEEAIVWIETLQKAAVK